MATPTTMSAQQRQAFTAVSTVVMPVWAAMILAPRTRLTARLVDRSAAPLLAGLGATYVGLLARGMATGDGERADLRDPEQVRALLQSPEGFLTGWVHYLVLDLFLGIWIWRTAQAEGRRCRLALVLALMAGPAGLLVFALQRRLAPLP